MRLSRSQRASLFAGTHKARLLAGDYRPFVFDTKPDCEPGLVFVFAWSRPRRHCDPETGQVFDAPAAPAAWVKVTKVVRQPRHWVVHFDVFDNRHLSLMPARGLGYTTDPRVAVDRFEAVLTEEDMRKFAADARAARANQLEGSADQRRKQERALRSRLRETLQDLSPAAQTVLLAELERVIRKAQEDEREAA